MRRLRTTWTCGSACVRGQAQAAKKYLPSRSPGFSPELAKWLDEAIRGARIEEGFFEIPGFADERMQTRRPPVLVCTSRSAMQSWIISRAGRLCARPPVKSGSKTAACRCASVAASCMTAGYARQWPECLMLPPGQVPRLLLQADLGTAVWKMALRTLREAPIPNQDFADWRGQGALSAKLQLDIPLAAGAAPGVQVAFSSEDASSAAEQSCACAEPHQGRFQLRPGQGPQRSGGVGACAGT